MLCNSDECSNKASLRCGNCKIVKYCSKQCQKKDWKRHKTICANHTVLETMKSDDMDADAEKVEKRECRCMFCGDILLLKSEDEAVDHMRVCPSLQEQLRSDQQFTIPSCLNK